jgi:DNA integrity scanning protein DisA with diadenylate cyclase activity
MHDGVSFFTGRGMRAAMNVLGALAGVASIVGMLAAAIWTVSTISADLAALGRRMGLVEVQLADLSGEVGSLREAVIRLQDQQPTNHADAPAGPLARRSGIN